MKRIFLTLCLVLVAMQGFSQATVREVNESIKTYPFSDPNPVPEPSNFIYPYFRYDGYAVKGVEQNWKVVELENPYIKVSVFPQVGGKIWGAIDKTTGKEFVYKNNVMKFRNIAMRGPWTSGGIEFNFGVIGHVPSTATPVDYVTKQKSDGSASCYVSSYEWVTHTWWTVEVNVPADKAFFTTNVVWHNSSDMDEPYYQWMNAGYPSQGKAEFTYPGTHYIGHGGELHSYPYDEDGHNIGTYEGNNQGPSVSYHVLGKYNDFYGVYYHDKDYGSIHYADYADKLGMKIFLWGTARSGAIWEDLLTDGHGQYIELQAGRMFNQPAANSAYTPYKHTYFVPQGTDRWTEYWFPVEKIGNVLKANNYGALNVTRENGQLIIRFSPLQKLNTELYVYDGDKLVKTFPLQTEVLKVWEEMLPLTGSLQNEGTLKIKIGNHLLEYSEVMSDNITNRPKVTPKDFDWNSVYGFYTQGDQELNQKYYNAAESHLKKCLEKDANFMPALYSLATVYYHEGRYNESLELCKRALAINTYDGKVNYLYGLNNQILGNIVDAKDGFSIASRSAEVCSAAYEKLAEMFYAEADYLKARHFAERSLDFNTHNLSSLRLLMTIYRKTNASDKAKELINKVLEDDPLYHPVRFEAYKAGIINKSDFTSAIRNELNNEVYVEIANQYESIKDYEDAIELLGMIDSYPIANYKRAYLLDRTGKASDALALVEKANNESPDMVFPHRASTLKALEWAKEKKSNWKIDYYCALIYWGKQQKEIARKIFSGINNADDASFYLTRASLEEGDAKLADLKRAEQMQKSWRTGLALVNYYSDVKDWKNADIVGKKYMKLYPDNYILGLKYAKVLCNEGQNDKCLSLLNNLTVLPNEGASEGRVVYRTAHLNKAVHYMNTGNAAKALKEVDAAGVWPENLGVGKPYDKFNDTRLETFLAAEAQVKMGNKEKAQALYKEVPNNGVNASYFKSANLLDALALKAQGNAAAAEEMVNGWVMKYSNDVVAQCCEAIYKGDTEKAKSLVSKYKNPKEVPVWQSSRPDNDFELIQSLFLK
ncbi:DUF5107 domain-containing protein [Phocaeicola oris]|uniref:DUF5107 domain-containing protein n=1 Tax=Phocaeicola oris TaxID=2896850 RepID=UPI00234E77D7|nr:DUF5107 domain-containing protein [Phocaeicola oris]MCE2616137.1 DUF5107 domain-containing protein [Phocaeicola oris]